MRKNESLSPHRASPGVLHLVAACAAGPFLDGYSTASAAFLIALIDALSVWETALFTSLYLTGTIVGALVTGAVADRTGRRRPALAAMALTAIVAALAAVSQALAALLVMRLATGFLLCGDYPVGQALVVELAPEHKRPGALSSLMLAWYFGALSAVALAVPVVEGGLHWSLFLWAEAAAAAAALILRLGIPESPLWLKSRRSAAARDASGGESFSLRALTSAISRSRSAFFFCCAFWLCQTIPGTIMMTYSPTILHSLTGTQDAVVQMALIYGCFLIGILPSGSRWFRNHLKTVLLLTFVMMAAGILGVLVFGRTSTALTNISFVVFALSYGLQSALDFVYPNLLFKDGARAWLVGAVTAVSRIGAAGAAFLYPPLAEILDLTTLFCCGLLVLAAGFFIGWRMAPADAAA